MGRIYTAPFQGVAIAAAQDVFELLCPADCVIVLHRCEITDETSETSEQGVILMRRGTGSVTSGSGGSTITPAPMHFGDAASGATIERNNTTAMAVGTGVLTTIAAAGFNWLNGFLWAPTPEERIYISPDQRFAFNLVNAPGASRTCSGVLVFEELGG